MRLFHSAQLEFVLVNQDMAEAPLLPVIEEEETDDEFYKKIEVFEFIDFNALEILTKIATGFALASDVTKIMKKSWTLKQSTRMLFFGCGSKMSQCSPQKNTE
ncbi:uncharacterized protein LOC129289782 [Prosopis cineraria]|uniref:uncharacterized protein LOC129289782 n=1 Tax=Prosopis cineraria TaxID=364024 RepID=UPI0024107291|nr:uncharacterized protein LOC129289782 [Prosopis cineraria]